MTDWAVKPAIEGARHSAVHLEMRDAYAVDTEDLLAWRDGVPYDPEPDAWWYDMIRRAVDRGVAVRRARIVSEPVSEYIRFEYEITKHNIESGEDVRWLARRRASDLALPGNDYWLVDRELVIFNHFTGDGQWADEPEELNRDRAVVGLCVAAFDAVWERATPHADYRL